MAAGSKFERLVACRSCGDMVHPWPGGTCLGEFLLMGRDGALGSGPYVLLFYLAKLAVSGSKGKDIKEEFRRLPFKVLRLTFLGVVLASGIVGSICSFRWFFGKFRWYFVGFAPGFIGGLLSILTQSQSEARNITSYFYVAAVEYGVRKIMWAPRRRLLLETLLFSTFSAALVRLQRLSKPTSLPWFCYPEACPASEAGVHDASCLKHGLRGAGRLALFGVALGALRIVLPVARNLLNRRPINGGAAVAAASRAWSFPAFLAAYALLQRLGRCALAHRRGADDGATAAASGALAGAAYLLHPSLSVLAAALASVGQLAAQDKVPGRWWPQFVYSISLGFMLHARLNEQDVICPPFAKMLFRECTSGRADRIIADYKALLQLNK